jgi:adenylosuccinate lyase
MTPELIKAFVESLDIPDAAKKGLMALTPGTYVGNAADQARDI